MVEQSTFRVSCPINTMNSWNRLTPGGFIPVFTKNSLYFLSSLFIISIKTTVALKENSLVFQFIAIVGFRDSFGLWWGIASFELVTPIKRRAHKMWYLSIRIHVLGPTVMCSTKGLEPFTFIMCSSKCRSLTCILSFQCQIFVIFIKLSPYIFLSRRKLLFGGGS